MKTRFDSIDVTAMIGDLQSLIGRRVVNIYDEDNATYIVKLDGDGRAFLLLESGIRFHPIQHYQAATSSMPSPFCAKLRKHLRGLRLETATQVANDRVVVLNFGVGESRHSLIVELYARGNLILCDGDYRILALLRSHTYDGKEAT